MVWVYFGSNEKRHQKEMGDRVGWLVGLGDWSELDWIGRDNFSEEYVKWRLSLRGLGMKGRRRGHVTASLLNGDGIWYGRREDDC